MYETLLICSLILYFRIAIMSSETAKSMWIRIMGLGLVGGLAISIHPKSATLFFGSPSSWKSLEEKP